MNRRRFLLGVASSAAIAICLAGPAPLIAAATKFIFIKGGVDDPRFNDPYIDVEEWRDAPPEVLNIVGFTTQRPDAPPFRARHLYVHGGFKGTDLKFTIVFPPKEQYQGRFYQVTHQLLTNENTTPYNVAMAMDSGAYFVQTNMGGSEIARSAEDNISGRTDPSIGNYRANAAAAQYSRVVAQRVYGRKHRPFGYIYGGSGGAYQIVDSAQNTSGVWDGFIPYVMGNLSSNPSQFLVRAHALRVLKNKWPSIMDAVEPGGSGNPYAGLNAEERIALEEATLYGFPQRGWFNYVPAGTGPLGYVAAFVHLLDPGYIQDFWNKPGYLQPTSSAPKARVQATATIVRVIPAQAAGARSQFRVGTQLELTNVPAGDLFSADLIGVTGEAKGLAAPLGEVNGNTVTFHLGAQPAVVNRFKAGDTVRIDNSEYLALQSYYRHALPRRGSVFDYPPTYASFRNADGSPKYVQRAMGPVGLKTNSINVDAVQGKINGKMIVVQCMMDGDALPWMASWYRDKVRQAMGPAFNNTYRVYFIDNAQHSTPTTPLQKTHVVSYMGVLDQALRDLSAWVEKGVVPPPSTSHSVTKGQVIIPATAAARRGIQPVVDLKVNGGVRTEIKVGQPVNFAATIEMPPGTGPVTVADWDFEGTGTYSTPGKLSAKAPRATVTATHRYTRPGTYFAAIRATAQRQGNAKADFALVQNLGRVRVVVT